MKSEIIEAKPKCKYPYLGIDQKTGGVILFTKRDTGMVVRQDEDFPIGEYDTNWDESSFTPFAGTVQLSND